MLPSSRTSFKLFRNSKDSPHKVLLKEKLWHRFSIASATKILWSKQVKSYSDSEDIRALTKQPSRRLYISFGLTLRLDNAQSRDVNATDGLGLAGKGLDVTSPEARHEVLEAWDERTMVREKNRVRGEETVLMKKRHIWTFLLDQTVHIIDRRKIWF